MTPPEVFYEQTWDLSYRHSLGDTAGRFLDGLRERQLLARKCPSCNRRLLPPRSYCDRCHSATTDWSEVELQGQLEMFTIVCEQFKGLPPPPYAIGYALLRGADTALLGYIRGLDLGDLQAAVRSLSFGAPIRVRFATKPTGKVTDYWFELSDDERDD